MNASCQSANYLNGNGTVVAVKTTDEGTWTIRMHSQRVQIGDLAKKDNLVVYDNYTKNRRVIGDLKLGEYMTISQVAEETIDDQHIVWLKIRTDEDMNGWILFGRFSQEYAPFYDPYFDNRWQITGYIQSGKKWTIRKMIGQMVAVWEVLNIRDKPGLSGSRVISQIVPPEKGNPQVNLEVTEATEETEVIDGRDDRWLKTRYHGVVGWIFGGYAQVMKGGPKYYTPASIIDFGLGYY